MTVTIAAISILIAAFGLAWATNCILRHGLATSLDLLAARLISLADAWRAGQAKYGETITENLRWAQARK